MADAALVDVVRTYLAAVRKSGIHATRAILFGSCARGEAGPHSDIDILVIAPEFDSPGDTHGAGLLWELRASTDSRIEPIPVGEREWEEDEGTPVIEIARQEGRPISLAD